MQIMHQVLLAAEIYYARRCFENDLGGNVDNAHEGIRRNSGTERGASGVNAEDGNIAREGEGAFADIRDARSLIIDGEKDDAHKFWKDILEKEIDYSVGLLTKPQGHSIRQGAFSISRSMDEIKEEANRDAFVEDAYKLLSGEKTSSNR